jgi:hypothetical protein
MLRKLSLIAILAFSISTQAMVLSSQSWNDSKPIQKPYACKMQGGENLSPQLSWTEAPKQTQSYLVIVHDPDAPRPGGFTHWVVYINDPKIQSISKDLKLETATQISYGLNDLNSNNYFGPCPPANSGTHHYIVTVYALKSRLDSDKIMTEHRPELLKLISDKILDQTTLTGLYKNSP